MRCHNCQREVDETERGRYRPELGVGWYELRHLLEHDETNGIRCTCDRCQNDEQKMRRQAVQISR